MSIKKTKNGTYQLRVYIPEDTQAKLGLGKQYEKRFKTRREAKEAELKLAVDIEKTRHNKHFQQPLKKEDILFSDFYEEVWLEPYKAGQTTSTSKPPSRSTIANTKICFEKHILPLLGNYTIQFLNQNKQVILNLMTAKANEYANFKTLRSYVISIFDWAEELEYIEANRVSKTIKRIKAIKR